MKKINHKHCCVINAEGFYRTIVLVLLEPDEDGQEQERVQYYTLAEGESLINTAVPSKRPHIGNEGYICPLWNGQAWIEGATPEEIAAWELEHPAPQPFPPDPQEDADALLIDHEYRLTLLELGVN